MKPSTLSIAVAILTAPVVASAATADGKTVKPFQMSCEEFLSVSETYKPAVIYWIASVDSLGVRESDEIVVDTPQTVGRVVEECRKTPKQNLAAKVKTWIKDHVLRVNAKAS